MAKPSLAVLLLGRGGFGSAAKNELQAMLEQCRQAASGIRFALAFVDRNPPSLPQSLEALCAPLDELQTAALTIVVQFGFVPDEPALRRWLQKVAMRWLATRAAHARPRLVFAAPLLQTEGLVMQLLQSLRQAALLPDIRAELEKDDWHEDPLAWSSVPEYCKHVLWCMGPRCAAKGAVTLWPRLSETVQASPVLKQTLMLLQTSCQYPCNRGPLMIIYPDGAWYGPLDERSIAQVLKTHIEDRKTCEEHLIYQH